MRFRKYTKEQLIEAIRTSRSYREALMKLGIASHGGNYRVMKSYVEKLSLDISHFSVQAWNKDKVIGPKRDIDEYLMNKVEIGSFRLKRKLISSNILKPICSNCKNTHWLGNDIPLELHHVDGNSKNNQLSNLKLLCPNCHALTNNYRSKNRKVKT